MKVRPIAVMVLGVALWSLVTAVVVSAEGRPVRPPVTDPAPMDTRGGQFLVADDLKSLGDDEWAWVDHVDQVGPVQGLQDVERGYSSDPRRSPFCHQLVHELGRRALRLLGSLPGAVAAETGWCGGGFTHGVFEEWARHVDAWDGEVDLVAACGDIRSEICGHGIGHALMQARPDLADAFRRCETLLGTQGWDCVEGVLMLFTQSYLRPHPDDPRFDKGFSIRALCEAVPSVFVEQCEWTSGATWVGVTGVPDRVRALYQCRSLIRGTLSPLRCAYGLGSVIPDVTGWDVDAGMAICDGGPAELAEWCVNGLVWVLGEFAKRSGEPHPCLQADSVVRERCDEAMSVGPLRERLPSQSH